MPNLSFNEDAHTYSLDSIVIPSVTQVLPYNSEWFTEQSRVRGKYVHQMIEMYNQNELDEDSLDPILQGYLESYKQVETLTYPNIIIDYKSGSPHPCTALQLAGYAEMVKANKTAITGHEVRMYHPIYRYGGTMDYVRYEPDEPIRVFALYLFADGKQGKYIEHTDNIRQNIGIFLSFLTVQKWKEANKLL